MQVNPPKGREKTDLKEKLAELNAEYRKKDCTDKYVVMVTTKLEYLDPRIVMAWCAKIDFDSAKLCVAYCAGRVAVHFIRRKLPGLSHLHCTLGTARSAIV